MHVESEHSAISACMGASAIGARTFTASSSQGLLYMAEGLHYCSGGRYPVVMMNANRSVALTMEYLWRSKRLVRLIRQWMDSSICGRCTRGFGHDDSGI
jgi:pyruvate/2-oxoacid:ferredoxin oxidoreductase alpha subunit